ncbi:MAG: pentapeptide repeat-containing protein [Betaproteobacteria bacterium]|nr:pentapeptide repeat-containing protein [Betaproteobacteria bacterium]
MPTRLSPICIAPALLLALAAAPTLAAERPVPPEKRPLITAADFQARACNGHRIHNMRVPAEIITNFMLPGDAGAKSIKKCKNPRRSRIWVEESLIEGSFELSPDLPQTFEVETGRELAREPEKRARPVVDIQFLCNKCIFPAGRFERLNIEGIHFARTLSFNNSTFGIPVVITDSEFASSLSFQGSELMEGFELSKSVSNHTRKGILAKLSGARFADANFRKEAIFSETTFATRADFSHATFHERALFRRVSVGGSTAFIGARFEKAAVFSASTVTGAMLFSGARFLGPAYFNRINTGPGAQVAGTIDFASSIFSQRVSFRDSQFKLLLAAHGAGARATVQDEYQKLFGIPVDDQELLVSASFEKPASFTRFRCTRCDFTGVEFLDESDFMSAKFEKAVSFADVTFGKTAAFDGAVFTPPIGEDALDHLTQASLVAPDVTQYAATYLDGIKFRQDATIAWQQLDSRVPPLSAGTWASLDDFFRRAGDLESQNAAVYARALDEAGRIDGAAGRLIDRAQRHLWGYGTKPAYLFGWMTLAFLLFTWAYWTQTKPLAEGVKLWQGIANRAWYALEFSLRTSLQFNYGYANARSRRFKVIAVTQTALLKLLFVLLIVSLSRTSPLLQQVVSKLI